MASTSFIQPRLASQNDTRQRWGLLLGLGLTAVALGCGIAYAPLLALAVCGLTCVVLATPFVETLGVLTFWLLPYLIFQLPMGSITFKVPEITAYLFAMAALARGLFRREPLAVPPVTPFVLFYLAVLALSTAVSPVVPSVFGAYFSGFLGPGPRSCAILFWLTLSWGVVVSVYNIVGVKRDLFNRCVRAHILTGAFASFIGIVGYIIALRGGEALVAQAIGHTHTFIYTAGSLYRLTGVSYEPMVMAFYLNTVIPVSLAVVLYRPDLMPSRVAMTALFLQIIALLLTFSAGGFAALVVELALVALLLRPKGVAWRQTKRLLQAIALLCIFLLAAYLSTPMINRTMNDALSKIMRGGYSERNDEITAGLRMARAYPWLGVGPGMTLFYFPQFHPTSYSMQGRDGNLISNLYVTTLCETGVVGLLSLASCGAAGLGALVGSIRRHGALRTPVLTALTISLIGCAIQYWEMINLFLIYFPGLVGLAVAAARLADSQPELP